MKARAFLEAEEPGQRKVARTCELLEVSKPAYYRSLKAEPCTRARTDAELAKAIAEAHDLSEGTYGSPRVRAELAHRGISVGRRRVARLMRLAGLEGRCKRRWRTTAIVDKEERRPLTSSSATSHPRRTSTVAMWETPAMSGRGPALPTWPRS